MNIEYKIELPSSHNQINQSKMSQNIAKINSQPQCHQCHEGRFEIKEEIGDGLTARVFKTNDKQQQKIVALKVLN